jgi:hypothetical protein
MRPNSRFRLEAAFSLLLDVNRLREKGRQAAVLLPVLRIPGG